MPFEIRIRLMKLGRNQVDLIPELAEMGFRVNPAELSQAVNGTSQQPKIEKVASACNEIVTRWEKERT